MIPRRVVVTAMGAVTPVGNTADETWCALCSGKSGISAVEYLPLDDFPVRIAGQVRNFSLRDSRLPAKRKNLLSRSACFGVAALLDAIDGSNFDFGSVAAEEKGLAIGTSVQWPPLQQFSDMMTLIEVSGGRQLPSYSPVDVMQRSYNTGMSVMAQLTDAQGPSIGISTACASSAHAIGEAYRCIQNGEAKVMFAGGFDAMTSYLDILGFTLLGALTTQHSDEPEKASRPFSRDRSGFVLGEGGVVVVLEELEHALGRGASPLAEVLGYGSSMNGYRMTDAPPGGGQSITAMQQALNEAAISPQSIGYVCAHGTGTAGNDVSETAAIKQVFGNHAYELAVSSPKSMTGHLTSASGALNFLVAVNVLRTQCAPPTINMDEPDPALDLNYVPHQAAALSTNAAMANAFAFGGTNVSLVVSSVLD